MRSDAGAVLTTAAVVWLIRVLQWADGSKPTWLKEKECEALGIADLLQVRSDGLSKPYFG